MPLTENFSPSVPTIHRFPRASTDYIYEDFDVLFTLIDWFNSYTLSLSRDISVVYILIVWKSFPLCFAVVWWHLLNFHSRFIAAWVFLSISISLLSLIFVSWFFLVVSFSQLFLCSYPSSGSLFGSTSSSLSCSFMLFFNSLNSLDVFIIVHLNSVSWVLSKLFLLGTIIMKIVVV